MYVCLFQDIQTKSKRKRYFAVYMYLIYLATSYMYISIAERDGKQTLVLSCDESDAESSGWYRKSIYYHHSHLHIDTHAYIHVLLVAYCEFADNTSVTLNN